MPIKGITDTVQAAFPRIGKLRKGGEAVRDKDGKLVKMGPDLQYFRFTSERPEVVRAFEEAYGKQPALITAFLPHSGIEGNFECWKEKWSAGGLVHRCDGETMTLWMGPDGKYWRGAKPCDGGCDEVGRLSLIIPQLLKVGFVGLVTLETHGINDMLSIQASLLATLEARSGIPEGLKGVLWTLRRTKEKISTPMGNGKRARRDKWLVKLEPAAKWVELQLQAAHNATMMLPSPRGIDTDTGEIIEHAPIEVDAPVARPVDEEELEGVIEGVLMARDEDIPQDSDTATSLAKIDELVARLKWSPAGFAQKFADKYGMGLREADAKALAETIAVLEAELAKQAAK